MNDKSQDERTKTIDAYKKSLIAFIIAVFSEFGISIGPFRLVFVLLIILQVGSKLIKIKSKSSTQVAFPLHIGHISLLPYSSQHSL